MESLIVIILDFQAQTLKKLLLGSFMFSHHTTVGSSFFTDQLYLIMQSFAVH